MQKCGKSDMNAGPSSNASKTAIRVDVPLASPSAASGTFGFADSDTFYHLHGIIIEKQWEGGYAC
jgi:hypothetical protein